MEFGTWDGLTFAEIRERYPDELDAWLGSLDHTPGGGESFRVVREAGARPASSGCSRSTPAGPCSRSATSRRSRCWSRTRSGAPLESVYRMELAPASVTVLSFFADGNAAMRMFNARPTDAAFIGR